MATSTSSPSRTSAVPVAPESPTRRRIYRKGTPGDLWWVALLVLPTLLTLFVVQTRGQALQDELAAHSLAELEAAGIMGVTVQMHGRQATLGIPGGVSLQKAAAVVGAVPGIDEVDAQRVARSAAEARACEGLQENIDAALGTGVAFSGTATALAGTGVRQVSQVAKLLQRCAVATVVVEGHADASVVNAGTVSLRRAESVRDALVREGVKGSRIAAKGFGSGTPASKADTPQARALNNRVVVTVLED